MPKTQGKTAQKPLTKVISRSTLKLLAGGRSFSRGEEYHNGGLVESLAVDQDRATAVVHGTRTYRCKLKASGESLQGDCTCPAFEDAGFCKHLVAVGLAIINPNDKKTAEPDIRDEVRPSSERSRRRSKKSRQEAVSIEEIREYLSDLSREKLVEMLVSQAMNEASLLRALRLEILGNRATDAQTEKHKSPQKIIESIKEAIDQGVEVEGGYDESPDEYEMAQPLNALVKQIQGLLKDGMAAPVVELSEYFIAAVEPIIERFHEGSEMVEILEKLQTIHLAAGKKAQPDPEALARRLFRWELTSGWGVFENAPAKYKSVLGDKGLTTYRKLATAAWEKLPAKKERDYGSSDSNRSQLTRIMENLAKLSGNIEAEVAVKARDLSHSYDYLKIAELYASRKMRDQAIKWAEKGLKAFPGRPDGRLREFLAKEYHRLKRHDEAMALIWAEFTGHPSLTNFKSLKSHADLIDPTRAWSEWRKKGIEHIQAEVQKAKTAKPRSPYSMSNSWERRCSSSTLVEIYLWEKDIEAAWKQAQTEGADSQLWHQLAHKREKTHPADAATAYQNIVSEEVDRGGNESYRDAVNLVGKIQSLMKVAKLERKFSAYLEEIRANFKPKRNFIKLLDAKFGDVRP